MLDFLSTVMMVPKRHIICRAARYHSASRCVPVYSAFTVSSTIKQSSDVFACRRTPQTINCGSRLRTEIG